MKKLILFLMLILLFLLCSCTRGEDVADISSEPQDQQEEVLAVSEQAKVLSGQTKVLEEDSSTSKPQNDQGSGENASSKPSLDQVQPSQASNEPMPEPPTAVVSDTTVTIRIVCLNDVVLDSAKLEIESGDTVFDVLKRTAQEQRIPLDFSGGSGVVYIKGINNVYEFDMGAESGWMYKVNGVFPNASCGAHKLQYGDVIEWLYTKDMGKELGAGFD